MDVQMDSKKQYIFIMKLLFTSWQLPKSKVLHGASSDQRLLRVVQYMGQCVHTDMEVGDVHTHSLFSHSRLVCVTRRL